MHAVTRGKTPGERETRAISCAEALRLRIEEGISYESIGKRLTPPVRGITVVRMIKEALQEVEQQTRELVPLLRTQESARAERWLKLLHKDCESEDPDIKVKAIGKSLDVQARYLALHGIDVSPKGDTINVAIIANSTQLQTAIDQPELLSLLEEYIGQSGAPLELMPSPEEQGQLLAEGGEIELEQVEVPVDGGTIGLPFEGEGTPE